MGFTQSVDASKYKSKSGITIKAGSNFSNFKASAYADNLVLSTVEGAQQTTYTFTQQKGVNDTITFKLGAADAAGAKSQLAEIQHANNLQLGKVEATLGGSKVIAHYETTAKKPVNAGSVTLVDEANEGGNFKYSVQFTTAETVNASTGLTEYTVTANYFVQTNALGEDPILFDFETYTSTVEDEVEAWTAAEANIKTTSAGNDAYYSYQLTLDVPDGTDALSVITDTTNNYTTTLADTNINVIVKRQDGVYSVDRVIYADGDELASVAAADNKATIFGGKGLPSGIGGLFTLEFSNVSNTNLDVKYSYDYNVATDYKEQAGNVAALTASNDYATIEQTRTFERSALSTSATATELTITPGTGEKKVENKKTATMSLGTLSTSSKTADTFTPSSGATAGTEQTSSSFEVGTWTLSTGLGTAASVTLNDTATAQLHTASGADVNITASDATSTTLLSQTFTNSTSALANGDNAIKATIDIGTLANATERTAFATYTQDQRTQPITITFGTVAYKVELDFSDDYTTNSPGISKFYRADNSGTTFAWDSTTSLASVALSSSAVANVSVKLTANGSRIDASWTPQTREGTISLGTTGESSPTTMTIEYETDEFGNSKNAVASVNDISVGTDGKFTVEAGALEGKVKADTAFTLNADFKGSASALTWSAASLTGSAQLFEDAATALSVEYGIDVFGNSDTDNVTKINGTDLTNQTIQIATDDSTFNPAQATTFSLSGDKLTWKAIVNDDKFTIGGGEYTMIYDVDAFGNSKTDLKAIQYNANTDVSITFATNTTNNSYDFTIANTADTDIAATTTFSISGSDSSAKIEWGSNNKTGSIQFGTASGFGMVDIIYAEDKFGNSTYEIASLNADTIDTDYEVSVAAHVDDEDKTYYTFRLGSGKIGTNADETSNVTLYNATDFTISADDWTATTANAASVKWNTKTNTDGTVVLVSEFSDTTKFGLIYETDDFGNSTNIIDSVTGATTVNSAEVYDVSLNGSSYQFEMTNTWLGADKNTTFSVTNNLSTGNIEWKPWLSTGATIKLATDASNAVEGTVIYRTDPYGNSINEIGTVKIGTVDYDVATDTNTFTITADSINGYGHDIVITVNNDSSLANTQFDTEAKDRFTWNAYTGRSDVKVKLDGTNELTVEFGTDIFGNTTTEVTQIDSYVQDGTRAFGTVADTTLQTFTLDTASNIGNMLNPAIATTFTITGFTSLDTDTALIEWLPTVREDTVVLSTNAAETDKTHTITYEADAYGNTSGNVNSIDGTVEVKKGKTPQGNDAYMFTVPAGTSETAVDMSFYFKADGSALEFYPQLGTDKVVIDTDTKTALDVVYAKDEFGNDVRDSIVSVGGNAVTDGKFTANIDSNDTSREYKVTLGTDETNSDKLTGTISYDATIQTKTIKVTANRSATNAGDSEPDVYTLYYEADGFGNQTADWSKGIRAITVDVHGRSDGPFPVAFTTNSDGSIDITGATVAGDTYKSGYQTLTLTTNASNVEEIDYTVVGQRFTEESTTTVNSNIVRWYGDYDASEDTSVYSVNRFTATEASTTTQQPYQERAFAETTALYDDFITADTTDLTSITTKTVDEAAITTDLTTDFSRGGITLDLTAALPTKKKNK